MHRLSIFLFFISFNFSNSISVLSEIDTTSGSIGDVFNWLIKVKNYEEELIDFPDQNFDNDYMSIRTKSIINNGTFAEAKFEILFWDTGSFKTPEYKILLNKSLPNESHIDVPSIIINIIPNSDISINNKLRPLIGPVKINEKWISKIYFFYVALIFFLVAIVFIIIRRKKPEYEKFEYSRLITPKKYALNRLNNASQIQDPKEFYYELSHISREFFEKFIFIRTLEMNTKEIIDNRKLFILDDNLFNKWIEILVYADKVKYAQAFAEEKKMQTDLGNIRLIIDSQED